MGMLEYNLGRRKIISWKEKVQTDVQTTDWLFAFSKNHVKSKFCCYALFHKGVQLSSLIDLSLISWSSPCVALELQLFLAQSQQGHNLINYSDALPTY